MWICQTCNYRGKGNRSRHIHQPLGHSIAMPHFQTRLEFVLRAFANRTFISQTLSFIIFISYRLLNLINLDRLFSGLFCSVCGEGVVKLPPV